MDTINADTKISTVLKGHPDALEAIISISSKFTKLRNPLLRKIMASRTTISTASKVGGCTVDDFFEKLQPLGFIIDKTNSDKKEPETIPVPDFIKNLTDKNTVQLDVRQMLDEGKDPFNFIFEKIKLLKTEEILKLITGFEPVPLIQLLEKQGFEIYSETLNDNLVFTYFTKSDKTKNSEVPLKTNSENWDLALKTFANKLKIIDVRQLEMPLPMLTILDELEKLSRGNALFVYHKRIPVFLLPELQDREYEYSIRKISENEVHLLIFKRLDASIF